jgi:hypothetical protein
MRLECTHGRVKQGYGLATSSLQPCSGLIGPQNLRYLEGQKLQTGKPRLKLPLTWATHGLAHTDLKSHGSKASRSLSLFLASRKMLPCRDGGSTCSCASWTQRAGAERENIVPFPVPLGNHYTPKNKDADLDERDILRVDLWSA